MNPLKPPTRMFLCIRKLPTRYAKWVMPLLLSVLMTSIVSFISTLKNIGFVPDLLRLWLSAWAVSWVIAFPALLVALPIVRKATAAIVDVE